MLWVLLKKQMAEVFKSYFYDAKRNRMRSGWGITGFIAFYLLIMVGLLGGMFTALSKTLCPVLTGAGLGWLYFLLMNGMALGIGTFGSVFSACSGLYLAKDNDLLLSLPIPVRTILAARVLNVYLLGVMYAATVHIPAQIVYWTVAGLTLVRVICGLLLFLIVTALVLLLSLMLGWVAAKISPRLKNRSVITVLVSFLLIVAYYFFYFRASGLVQDILRNAAMYGERIKGAAAGLFLFGRIGEGDWAAAGIFTAVAGILFALVWTILSRSFVSIATAGVSAPKGQDAGKRVWQKPVFRALLDREFARFTSSPNYMLNCGLGILLLPAFGVLLLLRGRGICSALNDAFASQPGSPAVLIFAMLGLLSAMNSMAAPSVSLEGRSLWILKSLPVEPRQVLRAKVVMQLILSEFPMLISAICAGFIVPASLGVRALLCLVALVYVGFSALLGVAVGVSMPILTWTNEIVPIKQSGAVSIVLFGSWGFIALVAGTYLGIGYRIGPALYLLLLGILLATASAFLLRWLDTKGSRRFAELS
ncbi:MAG: hypothetical protein IJ088_16895 [Clostridia bacterium]|nr:hypothetical protein [Clostridia bacterium]